MSAAAPARKPISQDRLPDWFTSQVPHWVALSETVEDRLHLICTPAEQVIVRTIIRFTVGDWRKGRPEKAVIPIRVFLERTRLNKDEAVRSCLRALEAKQLIFTEQRKGKESIYSVNYAAFEEAPARPVRTIDKAPPIAAVTGQRYTLEGRSLRIELDEPTKNIKFEVAQGELPAGAEFEAVATAAGVTTRLYLPLAATEVTPPSPQGGVLALTSATIAEHLHELPDSHILKHLAAKLGLTSETYFIARHLVPRLKKWKPRDTFGLFLHLAERAAKDWKALPAHIQAQYLPAADAPAPAPPPSHPSFDLDVDNEWNEIRRVLKSQISGQEFENWLAFTGQARLQDGALWVYVVDAVTAEFIHQEFNDNITTAIAACGLRIKRVGYEVLK